MKSGPEGPVERFDEAQPRQGHALRVGRRSALARSLDCQIASAIWLHSLTPKALLRPITATLTLGLKPKSIAIAP